ncbi:hypothetical protein PsorP6_006792 [Peronosclerospora sorghi]|uniref:Uncharacterized protein n=1 Tax=Peronosclerospora sorghi TaxID=230839 RepID=A0ACC0W7F6_9STRA|nr:hypothetical protein PsorP6_006792 [Peronosclerospora sorghi]
MRMLKRKTLYNYHVPPTHYPVKLLNKQFTQHTIQQPLKSSHRVSFAEVGELGCADFPIAV